MCVFEVIPFRREKRKHKQNPLKIPGKSCACFFVVFLRSKECLEAQSYQGSGPGLRIEQPLMGISDPMVHHHLDGVLFQLLCLAANGYSWWRQWVGRTPLVQNNAVFSHLPLHISEVAHMAHPTVLMLLSFRSQAETSGKALL